VTFIFIHSVIIYVVFFGACMRCTRLCSLKSGVIGTATARRRTPRQSTPPDDWLHPTSQGGRPRCGRRLSRWATSPWTALARRCRGCTCLKTMSLFSSTTSGARYPRERHLVVIRFASDARLGLQISNESRRILVFFSFSNLYGNWFSV
jgi:hypothetical protein